MNDDEMMKLWCHEALRVLEADRKMREELDYGYWTKVPWWRRFFLREKPEFIGPPPGPCLDKINVRKP
jgi:hypothetical protein